MLISTRCQNFWPFGFGLAAAYRREFLVESIHQTSSLHWWWKNIDWRAPYKMRLLPYARNLNNRLESRFSILSLVSDFGKAEINPLHHYADKTKYTPPSLPPGSKTPASEEALENHSLCDFLRGISQRCSQMTAKPRRFTGGQPAQHIDSGADLVSL